MVSKMAYMDLIKIAFKKLKANIFFDKTQLPLRDRIVLFEHEGIAEKLNELHNALMCGSDWSTYEQNILDQIDILIYPKKLTPISKDTAIFNADNMPIELSEPQYFIDLPIEGHILGTLWILTVGSALDKNSDESNPAGMYEHSYGNRLKKTLVNDENGDISYSPSLFEPYFAQYESWRDYGLEKAKERLDDKQDAIVLTLDFKSFYYSVHLDESHFRRFLECIRNLQPWHEKINDFVFKVIHCYSEKLRNTFGVQSWLNIGTRNILPIGFLPSNILSNWVLTAFDDAIIDTWNPVYYGRYVDDIIIVDKVEKNDPLYKKAHSGTQSERLSVDDVLKLKMVEKSIFTTINPESNEPIYQICENALICKESVIQVQSKKVKLFYFQSGATRALLDCFKTKIAQNASEFRLLPDMDQILEYRNYSEIFDLQNEESINKFRGITGIELDRFALSKFLGKYRKVSGLIQGHEENEFEKDLMLIFDERTLIANYSSWERLLEILVVNNRFELYKKLAVRIVGALKKYDIPKDLCSPDAPTHDALLRVFLSAIHRTAALVWKTEFESELEDICSQINILREDMRFSHVTLAMFDMQSIKAVQKAYCETRMVNKYLIPLPIDCAIKNLNENSNVNLCDLDDMRQLFDASWLDVNDECSYVYYPYMVTPQELSFVLICKDLIENKQDFNPSLHHNEINRLFILKNYLVVDPKKRRRIDREKVISKSFPTPSPTGRNLYYTKVAANEIPKNTLRIAVGSVRLHANDFERVLDLRPNRSYGRYRQFAQVFDEAVREKADLLVLPENYLPFEWLPVVARLCANNGLALVTGIEHTIATDLTHKSKGVVYNLTATILPYKCDDYPFASISYHNKVAYSPGEIEEIVGRRYSYIEGNTYQLFGWRNVWFPVYCCFELASIQDRCLFKSYADMIVTVEWNKDISYYSNIIESLSRDLHCYCVQVNSSDYGDSRIVAPKESHLKDIIRTKGGLNACILVDVVDIKSLRDFQMLSYRLQKQDGSFKPSPPDIDPDNIIDRKRRNKLFK